MLRLTRHAGRIRDDGGALRGGRAFVPDIVQGVVDAYVANGDVAEEDAGSFYDEVAENSDIEGEDGPFVPSVTVYHGIVDDGERAGDDYKADVVDMLSFLHSKGDTALLKLDGAKDLPTIEISDESDVGVGTPIVAIGYPGSVSQIVDPTLEPTFKDGTVSAQRTQAGVPFYEVSAASTPGMSGGPVVDLEGKVIGIVSQSPAEESQSFNLMASVSIAQDMMRENDVSPAAGPNDAAYRRGLEQLFDGECRDAVETFDGVLAKDGKHQQAFEIRRQAVKRATEGCGVGAGFPWLALVPLAMGIVGLSTVIRGRRKTPAVGSPVPAATPAVPTAPPSGPQNALVCTSCGHVHAREVVFCTRCGHPMRAEAATPSSTAPVAKRSRDRAVLIGSTVAVVAAALLFVTMRGDDGGTILATPSPTEEAVPRAEGLDLNGVWDSTYGPVTLEHDEISGSDAVEVTGSWVQGPDKPGEITGGTFDPEKGTLEITYTETWSGTDGTASFELSDDGDTLDGTYEQKNSRGAWVLTR